MYEKTIAADFRIYSITIPSTPTLIAELLPTAQRDDLDSIIWDGLAPKLEIRGKPHQYYKRHIVDGYIESYTQSFRVYDEKKFAYETVPANCQYVLPVWDWPFKTYVSGSDVSAIIRVFFT